MSEDISTIDESVAPDMPPKLRFYHSAGYSNVRYELESLLSHASDSLRIAVCFFTGPGLVLMRPFSEALNLPSSFFVASVDFPTNLDALCALHYLAPGHVYIHLGGSTPDEKGVGRALMHSKLLLAINETACRLWVGSHNFTGQAIEGGNLEAGVQIESDLSYPPVQDAMAHLDVCRTTAELFDPAQLPRYRGIQQRKIGRPPWIIPSRLLVIHAEALDWPTEVPFNVHLRVVPTDFDAYFVPDRGIRLYLYPPGVLGSEKLADVSKAKLWKGTLTAVVRTHLHPSNSGIDGQFRDADFELDMPDLSSPPQFMTRGRSTISPSSQVVLRMDTTGIVGEETYSIDSSPVEHYLDSGNSQFDLHAVDADMKEFFTPLSVMNNSLVYRPVSGVRQQVKVVGYEETMRLETETESPADSQAPLFAYKARKKQRSADAFLFVSQSVVRRPPQ